MCVREPPKVKVYCYFTKIPSVFCFTPSPHPVKWGKPSWRKPLLAIQPCATATATCFQMKPRRACRLLQHVLFWETKGLAFFVCVLSEPYNYPEKKCMFPFNS